MISSERLNQRYSIWIGVDKGHSQSDKFRWRLMVRLYHAVGTIK